ncbi:cytochrome-c peroxidase [Celeribacter sp.]|uniref:cytochrome-c peroxidase n=1 Tax=Celeribacter sp. TaxID=1890673 RepID=UPI003A93E09D
MANTGWASRTFGVALGAVCVSVGVVGSAGAQDSFTPLETLGEALFHDVNLSQSRSQSCATCHDPESGFADPRGMASPSHDFEAIGTRNAPTASYAALSPDFHRNADGQWVGGQFLDGRAITLEEQAGGPPVNPVEMAMADEATVVARLEENPAYVTAFHELFGADVFDAADRAYEAMTQALAAYERTEVFAPFDSKYDRYLAGEAELSREEQLGEALFFSPQFTNCHLCHQINTRPGAPRETFTNYEYFNIGVPVNPDLRAMNGTEGAPADAGLAENPLAQGDENQGRFKVPTLRNVAVTGPYMHNGVFEDLRTVVLFYNRYNTNADAAQINPETGEPWGAIPYEHTLANEELTEGDALSDREIDALVAFMKTLTDARYEYLLDE